MNCRENCPKILKFEQSKAWLQELIDEVNVSETKLAVSSASNRVARRRLAKIKSSPTGKHEALRALSDAEFYQSDASTKVSEAREQIKSALALQDDAIEQFVSICPKGYPVAVENGDPSKLVCAVDLLPD